MTHRAGRDDNDNHNETTSARAAAVAEAMVWWSLLWGSKNQLFCKIHSDRERGHSHRASSSCLLACRQYN